MKAVRADPQVSSFTRANFTDPSLASTQSVLVWDAKTNGYLWRVELMERECGCKGLARIDAVKAYVDPVSGAVVRREFFPAIKESEYGRKNCEGACHDG